MVWFSGSDRPGSGNTPSSRKAPPAVPSRRAGAHRTSGVPIAELLGHFARRRHALHHNAEFMRGPACRFELAHHAIAAIDGVGQLIATLPEALADGALAQAITSSTCAMVNAMPTANRALADLAGTFELDAQFASAHDRRLRAWCVRRTAHRRSRAYRYGRRGSTRRRLLRSYIACAATDATVQRCPAASRSLSRAMVILDRLLPA